MKVSVCIPTYNQSEYLALAVNSAFNQTLPPHEIIVSDDCSTDNTAQVLQQLIKNIPILKLIYQEKNLGISQNTDNCLRAATGDFIIRLDSDDILSPTYIEKLATVLAAHPEAAYAHAAVQEIDQHGNFLQKRLLARKSGFQTSNDALLAAKKGYRVAANIIMFRQSALQAVNYSTGRPSYVEDFHLSAALAATGFGNIYLSDILAFYRVWIDTGKTRQRRKLLEITGVRKVFEDILEPAYKVRGWNMTQLYTQRVIFAKSLADCLGWSVYTAKEKEELSNALNQLSSSKEAKLFAFVYLKGLGPLLNIYLKPLDASKKVLKNIIKRIIIN